MRRFFVLSTLAAGLILAVPQPSSATTAVAIYHMEDATTTLVDSSSSRNNGVLEGGVTTGLPGYVGLGYGFNGKDSVARVPDSPSLNSGRKPFTVSVAFKMMPRLRGDVDVDLVRKGLGLANGGAWKLELHGRAKALRVGAYLVGSKGKDHGVLLGPAGPKVNDGQWHRATLARTGATVSLTVDGQTVAVARRNVGKVDNAEALTIGAKPRVVRDGRDRRRDADWFRGVIDEVVMTVG